MTEYADYAAIVMPSVWPFDKADSHCTLLAMGEIPELNYGALDVIAVVSAQMLLPDSLVDVKTAGIQQFGEDGEVTVMTLEKHPILVDLNAEFKRVFAESDMTYSTTFPEYKPHITLGEDTDITIPMVDLYRPELWWGDAHYKL